MELSFIIIDDTELDHFIARKVIVNEDSTFVVKGFLDGPQALAHILNDTPHVGTKIILVFVDIYMPHMDGFQFVEEFEKLPPEIQDKYYVVALTSSKQVSDLNRINAYRSFKDIVTKPIVAAEFTELLNKITKQLNN